MQFTTGYSAMLILMLPLDTANAQEDTGIDLNGQYGLHLLPIVPEAYKVGLGASFYLPHSVFMYGFDMQYTNTRYEGNQFKQQSRITFPLYFGISFGNKLKFSTEIGWLVSFYLTGTYNERYAAPKKTNFGFTALIKLGYSICKQAGVFLRYDYFLGESSYFYSMPKIRNSYTAQGGTTQLSRLFYLSAGVCYKLR